MPGNLHPAPAADGRKVRQKKKFLVGLLVALALLCALRDPGGAQAAGLADSPWPMFQHDPQHTGRSQLSAPGTLAPKWRLQVTGLPGSPAIGGDGTIYLPTGNKDDAQGSLYAINPDGTLRWRYVFPSPALCVTVPTFTTPAIAADGTVYVHTQSGRALDNPQADCTAGPSYLFAINPDGTGKWTYPVNGGFGVLTSSGLSSPAVAPDGTIYLTSADTGVYAINPDGTTKWVVSPEATSIRSSPAIGADGTVYVNIFNLHAYEPDGDEKWTASLGGGCCIDSSPSVGSDGTIYACGIFPDACHAVGPGGDRRWSFPVETQFTTPTISGDGTIHFVDRTQGLYAVNPDGSQRWRALGDPEGSVFPRISHSPVAGADGRLYARDDCPLLGGGLHVLEPDGTESDEADLPMLFPCPAGGELSAAIGADGTLYMPEPEGGSGEYNPDGQFLAAYGPGGDECAKAKKRLRKAKKAVRRARSALRGTDGPRERSKAKKKLRKAKKKLRKAKREVKKQC